MPAPPSTSQVSLPSQNGATEFIIWSRSRSVSANGNKMPIPRSKPSRITYIATASPMIAAQITGRYDSMTQPRLMSSPGPGIDYPLSMKTLRASLQWPRQRSGAGGLNHRTFRSARDQPVDVVDAHGKHDAVD